ncbi:MAG: hypothetical protein AAF307_01125 [Pseudomonadota bacterium]
MIPLRSERWSEGAPSSEVQGDALAFINHLRFVSMRCRSKAHTELFQACALLHVGKSTRQEAYSEALMRCLGEALGKPAALFAPGTAELSFDEAWLIQLALATARGDKGSETFLLKSRVAHKNRRLLRFLIGRVAECLVLN